jgi:tryptophan-rich sensory protein
MNGQVIGNIVLMYAILIIVNLPAGWLGLAFESDRTSRLWYQPPGFVIPIVWFVLFTLMGIARYQVRHSANPSGVSASWWIVVLAILCASYAYYTIGLAKVTHISALWFGLWGNLVVIIFAGVVFYFMYKLLPSASWLILPVCLWTSFATLIVVGQLKQQGLL